jgi:hypothetical protein
LGWYSIVVVVCVVGLGLIVFSRHERQQAATNASTTTTTTLANTTAPLLTDHWQVALSVDICGRVGNLPRSANQSSGIITSGNGVVDIKPARAGKDASQFEGAKATVSKFLTAEGVTVTNTSMTLPSSLGKLAGTYDNGRKCQSKPGLVQVLYWISPSATSPSVTPSADVEYANGEMFMLAFLPKGASVARPLAQKQVAAFLKSQTTTTTSASTTTTKPVSTTTTKPVSTTTTKPVGTTTTTG